MKPPAIARGFSNGGNMLACKNFINSRRNKLKNIIEVNHLAPSLAVMMVGEDQSALAYVNGIKRTGLKLGINVEIKQYSEDILEDDFLKEIEGLNENQAFHGIMVQMPLPKGIHKERVIETIHPQKDVDGFTKENLGLLMQGEEGLFPCTAEAVMAILDDASIELEGKDVVIVGRSNVVGKPLGIMMLNKNATVTTVHSKTKDLASHTRRADVVVVAVGKANFLDASMIKEDAVVIDVGINVMNGQLVGDADFEDVTKKTTLITPVPGGVGGMTTTILFEKIVKCAMEE